MSTITTVTSQSKRSPERIGQHLRWMGKLTMTASYATGGDTLTAAQLGFSRIMGGMISGTGGVVFELLPAADPTTAKVKAYRQKDPAAGGGADIALVEVANATDLSALTPRAEITGR